MSDFWHPLLWYILERVRFHNRVANQKHVRVWVGERTFVWVWVWEAWVWVWEAVV
jgi:hypothetical protein